MKNPLLQFRRHGFDPWVRETPLEESMVTHSISQQGKSHGQWSLGVYSAHGHRELDTTEVSEHAYILYISA